MRKSGRTNGMGGIAGVRGPEQVRCGGHITFPHGKPASETSERSTVIKNDMVYLGPRAIPFKKQLLSGTHFVSLKIQRWLCYNAGISGQEE